MVVGKSESTASRGGWRGLPTAGKRGKEPSNPSLPPFEGFLTRTADMHFRHVEMEDCHI